MDSNQVRKLFLDALENADVTTREEFAAVLSEVPSGQYLCGCPWSGGIIPHFCPTHLQPPVFVIQGDRK